MIEQHINHSSQRQHWIGIAVLFVVLFLCSAVGWHFHQRHVVRKSLTRAEKSFKENDLSNAKMWVDLALKRAPDNPTVLLLAGRIAVAQHHYKDGVRYFREIATKQSPLSFAALVEEADLYFEHLPQPTKSIELYRLVVERDPQHVVANYRLAYLLGTMGYFREAIPHRLRLIHLDQIDPIVLYLLSQGDNALENPEQLLTLHNAVPEDPMPKLGLARLAAEKQQTEKAIGLINELLAASPNTISAHVLLGQTLLAAGREAEFRAWYHQLSETVRDSADYWLTLGDWSRNQNQQREAARCYWEALQRDPTLERALYQLSRLLADLDRTEMSALMLERSQLFETYDSAVAAAWTGDDPAATRMASETAESLGLFWEAYGWARLMQIHFPQTPWAIESVQRLRRKLETTPLRRIGHDEHLGSVLGSLNLAHLPIPSVPPCFESKDTIATSNDGSNRTPARLIDEAERHGLSFQYFNGSPRDQQSRRMNEFNGGGLAVLDFDNDGWPDLYFTQGCDWPVNNDRKQPTDRLFREKNGLFQDVSLNAEVQENDFSCGVSAGDYNNDGFTDLYITNIGPNRFLRNNGDGTFSETTTETETAGNDWSTSVVLADINYDGAPDLYVVNYLSGTDLFTRVCPNAKGELQSCNPRHFSGARDQLYMNQGDGSFSTDPSAPAIDHSLGKGLGVVAADFASSRGLELFIANDTVPNFFLTSSESSTTPDSTFSEEALVRGLAVNSDGRSEACMGIASGDVDADGDLDLFVTNFYNETNTLYKQASDGFFYDATHEAALDEPSVKMLGFGTQFLDLELDGDLDLIVTNGHIDDLTSTDIPYEMPPQIFHNDSRGKFSTHSVESSNSYFQGKYLGRGLARLDWNRDGLEDIAISHLDAPVALLTNRTSHTNHFVSIQLKGVTSNRDAIGATVTVRTGERQIVRQLTAGDGFQSSNEQLLNFGVGDARIVDSLEIDWPSGTTATFKNVPIDVELLFIEGLNQWLMRSRSER